MKSEGQKMKLFLLKDLFERKSDVNHVISVAEILKHLESNGISTTRKTVYEDIRALQEYGMDIVGPQERGYALVSRDFDIAEVKLLVDCIQASKAITAENSKALIGKLKILCSDYEAQVLQDSIVLPNRVKSTNKAVINIITSIYDAISANHKIAFTYFEYDENKQRVYTNGGERYIVSPFACIYDDNFYYLIAYDTPLKKFCTFRIDRMDDMDVRPHGRMGHEEFKNLDIVQFTKSAFSMCEGDLEKVTIRLPNSKMDAIIDRFGTDVFITKQGRTHFTTTVQVTVNQQFFGWIFGLGDDVEIVSPSNVREQMMAALSSIIKKYNP